jgi:hypothetical protein
LIDFCRISFAVFIMKANLSKRWYKDGHTLWLTQANKNEE